ncbi:hypothetical protein BG006_008987 [Podila minutissima]|uniref:Uncharacterized protein n=1 Tax=Podila minutissima TaxID=64525 RepID=A0A9P5VJR9_9FUNG|nr:hypothetical protein BG006_008987 [Podila minutissima]
MNRHPRLEDILFRDWCPDEEFEDDGRRNEEVQEIEMEKVETFNEVGRQMQPSGYPKITKLNYRPATAIHIPLPFSCPYSAQAYPTHDLFCFLAQKHPSTRTLAVQFDQDLET